MQIRTRSAPSPTGFAHVGNAYSVLFSYAFAKKNNGKFILRLEDTDQKRHIVDAEKVLYEGLKWLGFSWDEGPDVGGPFAPYRQSERLSLYKEKVNELVKSGLAYESEGAIRFKNQGLDMSWNDQIHGKITFAQDQITDFVILKSDGFPTYNFAVVIDDIEMKITHVIRGEEHISNTPRQLVLYKAFNATPPEFAHFPTLRNADHKKLSKRRDPVDLRIYKEAGYLPEALVNFLCLFGWSHPDGKEIFSLSEFVDKFSLDRVRHAGPIFDTKKLDWINGIYIRNLSLEELANITLGWINGKLDRQQALKISPLIKERITKLSEIETYIKFFWEKPLVSKATFTDPDADSHINFAINALTKTKEWTLNEINEKLNKENLEKGGFKVGKFFMTLRLAITGVAITPPINESIEILGKDETLYRLKESQKALLEII